MVYWWKRRVEDLKRIGIALRPTLMTSATITILVTALTVGLTTYFTSKKSLESAWKELSIQVGYAAEEVTMRYFIGGPKFSELATHLVERNIITLSDNEQVMKYCCEGLIANEQFSHCSFIRPDGSAIRAFRVDDKIKVLNVSITSKPNEFKAQTFICERGRMTLESETLTHDDFREPAYWDPMMSHRDGTWTEPYTLVTGGQRGFAFARPQVGSNGEFEGMWEITFEISELSKYLKNIKYGGKQITLILSARGKLIASSNPAYAKTDYLSFAEEEQFKLLGYIGYIFSFEEKFHMPWKIIVMIEKSVYFEPIKERLHETILIAVSLILLCIIFSEIFFSKISKRLKRIAGEFNEIAALRFNKGGDGPSSSIQEVVSMEESVTIMKRGLESLMKYMPTNIINILLKLKQPNLLNVKKTEVSILFCHLAQLPQMASSLEIDRFLNILEGYFDQLNRIIEMQQGIVDKYIGGGIMAFWGAPLPQNNHALLACKAALEIHKKFSSFQNLQIHIGLNTGEAIVGHIGYNVHTEYTVIGDCVNLASRLSGLNKVYKTSVILGEATAKSVMKEMAMRPLARVAVKGKAIATYVYELIDERSHCNENILKAMDLYNKGFLLFYERQFKQAKDLLHEANRLSEEKDQKLLEMLELSKNYSINPPPLEWTGIVILDQK